MASYSDIKAGSVAVELYLKEEKFQRGLRSAIRRVNSFKVSVQSIGASMLKVSAMISAPLSLIINSFAGFDDQMRLVQATTRATNKDFQDLTKTAERLGKTTSFTTKEVAEGMVSLGRMGFSSKEIRSVMRDVLDLSRATGTDLAQAAEIAANNMRTFGISSKDMSKVADILVVTANNSAQTLSDLGEALKMVSPNSAAAKDSLINVAGALGVLANVGVKGSLAGTALRRSYTQFANPKIRESLKKLGIVVTDVNGNLKDMPTIFKDIAKYMNKLPTAERLSFAEDIFDIRGSLAGLQIGGNIEKLDEFIGKLKGENRLKFDTSELVELRKNIDATLESFGKIGFKNPIEAKEANKIKKRLQNIAVIDGKINIDDKEVQKIIKTLDSYKIDSTWLQDLKIKMEGVDGAARNTAERMDSGIGGTIRLLTSAMDGLRVTLGRMSSEVINPYLEGITKFTNGFTIFVSQNKAFVSFVIKSAGLLAILGVSLLNLAGVTKLVSFSFSKILKLFSLIRPVLNWTILTVIDLAKALWSVASIGLSNIIGDTVRLATSIGRLKSVTGQLTILSVTFLKTLGKFTILSTIIYAFYKLGEIVNNFAGDLFPRAWGQIKDALSSGDLGRAAFLAMKTVIFAFKIGWQVVTADCFGVLDLISSALVSIGTGVLKGWNFILYGIKTVWINIYNFLADNLTDMLNWILDTFDNALLKIKTLYYKAQGLLGLKSNAEVKASIEVAEGVNRFDKYSRDQEAATDKAARDFELTSTDREWDEDNKALDLQQEDLIKEINKASPVDFEKFNKEIESAKADFEKFLGEMKQNNAEEEETTQAKQSEFEQISFDTQSLGDIMRENSGITIPEEEETDSYSKIGLYNFQNNAEERQNTLLEQIASSLRVIKQYTIDEGRYAI